MTIASKMTDGPRLKLAGEGRVSRRFAVGSGVLGELGEAAQRRSLSQA